MTRVTRAQRAVDPLARGTRVRSTDYGDGTIDAAGVRIFITWDKPLIAGEERRCTDHDASFAEWLEILDDPPSATPIDGRARPIP